MRSPLSAQPTYQPNGCPLSLLPSSPNGNDQLSAEFKRYMTWRRAHAKPSDHLFANRCGNRMTPPAFRKRLKLLSASRNIAPHLTPHQFRHSAATMMIENGVDIRIVQRLLGHASIATTEIYTQVTDLALQSAVARADVLSGVVPKPGFEASAKIETQKKIPCTSFRNHSGGQYRSHAAL